MVEHEWLAEAFEAHRSRLRSVAVRMLGSTDEAEDAVQEAWLRLSNVSGSESAEDPVDPEKEALLADSVGLALLVVLERLTPAERLAYVLHDMFDVPFVEVAEILERSPAAAKMLASRAPRRIKTIDGAADVDPSLARQDAVVRAFLAASRDGDFQALVGLLHPEVVLRADNAAVQLGGQAEVRGAGAVAGQFHGRAQAARPALVDGRPGAVWAPGGKPRVVIDFSIVGDRIVAMDLLADPERLDRLDLATLKNVGRNES